MTIPGISAIEMDGVAVYSTETGIWPPPGESDLETLEELPAAVYVSLFGDARAEPHELAVGEYDLRGWWGDSFPEVAGDTWGGKLYLEQRGKLSTDVDLEATGVTTPERIRERARDALKWLVDDGVASSIEISAELRDDARGVNLQVVIVRDRSDDPVTLRFDPLWESIRG
jgi:phage gp46-like protein